MKVLVLNCGSSSIKYQLRDTATDSVEASGLVSRIGEEESRIDAQTGEAKRSREVPIPDHGQGLELIVESLLDSETGVLRMCPRCRQSAIGWYMEEATSAPPPC